MALLDHQLWRPFTLADITSQTPDQTSIAGSTDEDLEVARASPDNYAGTVQPIIDSEFPLVDVAKAYQRARSGDANGKVIVAIR